MTSKLDNLMYSNTGLSITDEDKLKILNMVKMEINNYARTIRSRTIKYHMRNPHYNKSFQLHRNRKKRNKFYFDELEIPITSLKLIAKIREGYRND